MPSVMYVPSRIGEGHFVDFQPPATGVTDNGKVWAWNSATSRFEPVTVISASPGGSNTHVQFNNGGGFAGDSGFTYAGAGVATLSGRLNTGIVRALLDSTQAIQFQTAEGTNVFVVDAINKNIQFVPNPGASGNLKIDGTGVYFSRYDGGYNSHIKSDLTDAPSLTITAANNINIAAANGSKIFSFSATGIINAPNGFSSTNGFYYSASNISMELNCDAAANINQGVLVRRGTRAASGDNYIMAWYRGTTEFAKLTWDGRFGIGVPSPNSKLDVAGTVQMDGLRIDVAPTAETITCTHTVTFSANGTNYKFPCVLA